MMLNVDTWGQNGGGMNRGQFLQMSFMDNPLEGAKKRLYTWTSPDGKHRNQIDYILINKRWKST